MALSHYEINEYDTEENRWQGTTLQTSRAESVGTVAYFGNDASMEQVVANWCYYRHYDFQTEVEEDISYTLAVVDGASLTEENLPQVFALADAGVPLVFGSTPSVSLLQESHELAELLGITNIQMAKVTLEGMTLYEDFLVGGKVIYQVTEADLKNDENAEEQQDLNLNIPWFILNSGSKVYMDGILPEGYEDLDAAYKPPVIWRYRTGEHTVFVVNNDFMDSDIGLGMLTAMEGELSEFYVYPVVNAQSMVATNYPTFSNENTTKLHEIYSRDSDAVLRDLVWPGIAAVAAHNQSYPSICLTAKLNYNVKNYPDGEMLKYYLQLLRELHGEAGISMVPKAGTTLEEKLVFDKNFYDAFVDQYAFLFAYAKNLSAEDAISALEQAGFTDVKTILRDYDSSNHLIGMSDGRMILQISNEGSSHTYSEDLKTKSYQTLLGYSVIGQDFSQIIYPQSKQDQWEKVFDRFSRYTNTYWQNYDYYDELTLTETAQRCNRYLQLEYEVEQQGEKLVIHSNASKDAPAYFILQTGARTIHKTRGCEYQDINDGRYLITVTDATAEIDCNSKTELTFWR